MTYLPSAVISAASVYFNKDFFNIVTMSRGMLHYQDPDVPRNYLVPDVDNATLGRTLRLALNLSKRISIEEFHKLLESGAVQKSAKEDIAKEMQRYGYKTKKALYRQTDSCSVCVFDGTIEIQPSHQYSLDGYSGISNDGPEIQHLPITVSDEELGAALREGFTRCTSIYPR